MFELFVLVCCVAIGPLLGWLLTKIPDPFAPRRQWFGDTSPMSESNERYEHDRKHGFH